MHGCQNAQALLLPKAPISLAKEKCIGTEKKPGHHCSLQILSDNSACLL